MQPVNISTRDIISFLKVLPETVKPHPSNALGNAACRKFKSVRYIRMPELLDELKKPRSERMWRL